MFRAIPRAFLVLALGAFLMAGCRSSTDRMRVLEAEKADAERRNQELKQKEAEMRAQMVKAEGDAESNRAKADALAAQLELARNRDAAGQGSKIDIAGLRRSFDGTGVKVLEREGGGATLVIASDITFNAGQADLNQKAESTLGKVVRTLKETKGLGRIRVEGHTDSDPIRKSGFRDNEALSLARANTVQNFLIKQGIDETLVEVEGYGDGKPAASNDTPEGKARNRRVEIVLVGGE